MKKALLLLLFLALVQGAGARLLVTEVMYAPTQTASQTDSEWLEVYNSGSEPIDLAGWKVDGNSFDDIVLQPGQHLVIARELLDSTDEDADSFESYWGNNDGIWDERDGFLAVDGYFSLADSEDTINVSDGVTSEVLHYTSAIGGNANGKSIVRLNYSTNEWGEGKVDGTPGRGESSSSGNEIAVNANVLNSAPEIVSAIMSDVLPDAGVQAMPGDNVTVDVVVEDLNGASDITAVIAAVNGVNYSLYRINATATAAYYSASFLLPETLEAGTHTLAITAYDAASSTSSSIEFSYLSVLSTSIMPASISFGGIMPGNVSDAVGVTVINSGNVAIDIEVEGTELVSGNSTLPTSAVEYYAGEEWKALGSSAQPLGLNVGAGKNSEVQFRLNVPEATKAASYAGRIRIVARAV